jgi:hypothetical protein
VPDISAFASLYHPGEELLDIDVISALEEAANALLFGTFDPERPVIGVDAHYDPIDGTKASLQYGKRKPDDRTAPY